MYERGFVLLYVMNVSTLPYTIVYLLSSSCLAVRANIKLVQELWTDDFIGA